MNHELGLQVLSQILKWDDDEARSEFRWLVFMSRYKYDDYRDYLAGVRFIESLATWLQQFDKEDRRIAYDYIKNELIYISFSESQRLVEKFYPEIVQKHLIEDVSKFLGIFKSKIWSTAKSKDEFDWELRKSLFMGLSDGAKVDILRRANVGIISNEQIVASTQVDDTKWSSLVKDLRKDLDKLRTGHGNDGKFSRIYLIDDFTASGTSLIRYDADDNKYKGKLDKFCSSLENVRKTLYNEYGEFLESNWNLIVHHYIVTTSAIDNIESRYKEAVSSGVKWPNNIRFTFSTKFSNKIVLDKTSDHPFVKLCHKYYNNSLEDMHSAVSGDPDMTFGYAQCALPVVLEHNTPNNSLPLIWAETTNLNSQHAMRPLFRRRQRHAEFIE